jgi:hypothetical protein
MESDMAIRILYFDIDGVLVDYEHRVKPCTG